ncbi:MAG: hemolysin family protein [Bacteroidota bacterium]
MGDSSLLTLPVLLLLIFLSLVFSALFSGMEIAFVSSNKLKIEMDKKSGYFPARLLSYFVKHQSSFISTLLLGNNIALVVYGIFMARLLEAPMREALSAFFPASLMELTILVVQTLVSTLIILITAEFLPKVYFRINPNQKLSVFAIPVAILCLPLFGLVLLVYNFIALGLRLFKVDITDSPMVFGRIDLDNYLREVTEKFSKKDDIEHEIQIFRNALDFSKVKARECMVPRTEIVACEVNTPIEELRQHFVETGLSKILVYRDNIDNIIGYTHSFELFKKPEAIKNILLPIGIVPETMPANKVLELFIEHRRSLAVVVDEFGGTSGMLTIEDVVEEIFGEIEDEHDQESLVERQINDREYVFSARLEIDYLNEKYPLNLPESDDYETLAGLIIHVHEDIPTVHEKIAFDRFLAEILVVSENRIDLVRIRVKEEDQ